MVCCAIAALMAAGSHELDVVVPGANKAVWSLEEPFIVDSQNGHTRRRTMLSMQGKFERICSSTSTILRAFLRTTVFPGFS